MPCTDPPPPYSHLVTVPAGQHVLADVLATSPILEGEGGGAGGMDEFGIDPNVDPELALVCTAA
jgi:26S proteasome regulatory subunit N10